MIFSGAVFAQRPLLMGVLWNKLKLESFQFQMQSHFEFFAT
jgi:hypothetical protein